MIRDDEELRQTAVYTLKNLGLSEYAARTLVTLSELGRATARDISDGSSVPRTRVYDAIEELSEHGFATIEEGEPKVFDVASPARIRRRFYREYVFRLAIAVWSLRGIGLPERDVEEPRVSTTTDPQEIDRRLLNAVDDADRQVTFVPKVTDFDPELFAALADAIERGIAVHVVAVADVDADEIRSVLPGSTVIEPSGPDTAECARTRMLLTDDEIAHVGFTAPDVDQGREVGFFSDDPGTDVATLLRTLVETSIFDEFDGSTGRDADGTDVADTDSDDTTDRIDDR